MEYAHVSELDEWEDPKQEVEFCDGAEVVCSGKEDEWLVLRKNYVTASDVAAILGQHPHKSALALYNEKIGLTERDDLSENEAVKWGRRLEPVIAEAYAEETGRQLADPGRFTLLRSKKHPWLAATLDRIILPGADRPAGALEIKNTNAFLAREWVGEPPLIAQIQLQCQLVVTGLTVGSLSALIGGNRFYWSDQELNPQFVDYMLQETEAFIERVKTGTPPEVDGSESTKEAIRRLYPTNDPGKVIRLAPTYWETVAKWQAVKASINELEGEKNLYENQLRMAMGDASVGYFDDGTGLSYKMQTRKEHVVAETSFRVLRTVKK